MKKALKKLIPTIIMVLIAASMVGTSTFAWFSMNSKVTVTGMTVTTKVDDYLSIAASNHTEGVMDSQYSNALHQVRVGRMRPASTTTALDNAYYYTNPTNVQGNGDATTDDYRLYNESTSLTNTNAGKTAYDATFQTTYGMTDEVNANNVLYAYIDYTFYIKATNADTANAKYLCLKTCNLLYNGSTLQEHAWRVAVFAADITTYAKAEATKNTDYTTAWTTSERKAILTPSGAANFTANSAVSGTTGAGAITAVVYNSSTGWSIDTIGAGATEYNKVTVRLWLEGEDTTCNNETFATLTAAYTLDLGFELVSTAANSVQYINNTEIAANASGAVGSVTLTSGNLSNGETPETYAWKNAADGSAAAGTSNAVSYTAGTTGKYYCEITTVKGNVYRTPVLSLTA